jgi:hypothetical protein
LTGRSLTGRRCGRLAYRGLTSGRRGRLIGWKLIDRGLTCGRRGRLTGWKLIDGGLTCRGLTGGRF